MINLKAILTVGALAALTVSQALAQDIKFSLQLPLTGPIAFTGQLNQAGWQHAVDYLNSDPRRFHVSVMW